MATYAHNPLCVTPKMLAAGVPSTVVISASTEYDASWAAWRAFTQNTTDASWSSTGVGFPQWLKVDLGAGNARTLFAYTLVGRHDGLTYYDATGWVLAGSNDDSTWTDLDTQTGQSLGAQPTMTTYTLSAVPNPYRYFRLTVTASPNGSYSSIGELELLGSTRRNWHLPLRGRNRALMYRSFIG